MISKEQAILLVGGIFAGDMDKAGVAYIGHCLTVAERAEQVAKSLGLDKESQELVFMGGLWHDVVEDKGEDWGVESVAETVQSERVGELVDLLTHTDKVSYADYIEKIKTDKLATIIKFADSWHNSELSRFPLSEQHKHAKKCLRYLSRALMLKEHLEK